MKSNNPPMIAAWLLKLFTVDSANDPLIGDLIEEYRRGRSAFWFWRQTLAAIGVTFLKSLREHPGAPLFAFFWIMPMPLFWWLVIHPMENGGFLAPVWRLDWPYSTMIAVGVEIVWRFVYIWMGLAIYVVFSSLIAKRLDLRRFWKGSLVGVVLFLLVFTTMLSIFLASSQSEPLDQRRTGLLVMISFSTLLYRMTDLSTFLYRLPFFLTLALAILASLPSPASAGKAAAN